jgi:hypothetical protein
MKKLIILIVAVGVLGFLTWYTMNLMKSKGKSDSELIEFSISDTSTVDKIIITDAFSNKIELVRNGKTWTEATGDCISIPNVNFILETFKNIEFKGYLPENSIEKFTNLMASQSTKVEIFQNGEWTKTWFIGPSSADHYGQIMLLDSDEFGKSGKPVIMKIKGENGIIEPRFFADKRKWACTNIFALGIDQISKVELKVYDDPTLSFSVTKKGSRVDVYQQGVRLPNVDTAMVYRYLQKYKKIHYDIANFELSDKQVDSLKKSMPFAKLSVLETSGKKSVLRMFRIKTANQSVNEFGEIVDVDMDRFWCELPSGDVVKCQYFVFNPLILGHIYFPMDISKRKSSLGQGSAVYNAL